MTSLASRYLTIFHPKSRRITTRTAAIVVAFVWAVPIGLFAPWVAVYGEKIYNVSGFEYVACHAEWSSASLNRAFTVGVVFLTCYLLPLVIIAVFYLLIAVKVR